MHQCKQTEVDAWVDSQKGEPEMRWHYEIIYADTHDRYGDSRISLSLRRMVGLSRGQGSASQWMSAQGLAAAHWLHPIEFLSL